MASVSPPGEDKRDAMVRLIWEQIMVPREGTHRYPQFPPLKIRV